MSSSSSSTSPSTPTSTPSVNHRPPSKSARFLHRVERETDGLNDGQLEAAELQQYILSAVGGENFDSTQEAEDAASKALSNIDKL